MHRSTRLARSASALVVATLAVAGCSPGGRSRGSSGGTADMAVGPPGGCEGLGCFQMDCGSQPPTALTGKVTAPNGLDPVAGALVYVPTALPEFPGTAQCEVCNEPIGGPPVVSTTTAVDGTFKLTNVPATQQVPVVVQKGRFRKVSNLNITSCAEQAMTAEQTRLPRTQKEGDLPKMAVAVGTYDQIECVLHSIGIDQSEFTAPGGSGAVHLYDNGSDGATANSFEGLLNDPAKLQKYNLVFINCTGHTVDKYMNNSAWKANLFNYVNTGGRLYATDWSYDSIEQIPQFSPYIGFDKGTTELTPEVQGAAQYAWSGGDLTANISDPGLLAWLKIVGATTTGAVKIIGSWALADHVSANQMMYPSTTYVHGVASTTAGGSKDRPMTATFDYNMCGKVLWSSYHTQEPGGGGFGGLMPFPMYCASTPTTMIPQEKILEYLIFEISACVGPIS
jgi:hypothetical protein